MTSYWRDKSYEGIASYTESREPAALQVIFQSLLREGAVRRIARVTRAHHPLACVVDLACGVGDWSVRYTEFAQRVVGVDVNEAFLEAARAQSGAWRCEFVCDDLRVYQARDGADLVCLGGILMLLDDGEVDAMLGRIAAWLAPGGWLYVRATVATGAPFTTDRGYYRRRSHYERLFSAHGFTVVDVATSSLLAIDEMSVRFGLSDSARDALAHMAAYTYGTVRARRHGCDYLNWILTAAGGCTHSAASR